MENLLYSHSNETSGCFWIVILWFKSSGFHWKKWCLIQFKWRLKSQLEFYVSPIPNLRTSINLFLNSSRIQIWIEFMWVLVLLSLLGPRFFSLHFLSLLQMLLCFSLSWATPLQSPSLFITLGQTPTPLLITSPSHLVKWILFSLERNNYFSIELILFPLSNFTLLHANSSFYSDLPCGVHYFKIDFSIDEVLFWFLPHYQISMLFSLLSFFAKLYFLYCHLLVLW